MEFIYLDNNATTRPAPEVVTAVTEMLEQHWGNPSSVHRFGQQARQRVELARSKVAQLIGCRDRQITFSSGGTESNNLALSGVLSRHDSRQTADHRRVLLTTRVEHSAIIEPVEALAHQGVEVVYLPVDGLGRVTPDALLEALHQHASPESADSAGITALVSIQWANNETGVLQSIQELARICRDHQEHMGGSTVLFHTDATQAIGKIHVDVAKTPVDLLTMSAHKFHGPKGVGALYVRNGVRLRVVQRGGPQERQKRGGTENAPGIVGMGVAAELAGALVADQDRVSALRSLRDRLEQTIVQALPGTAVNSRPDEPRTTDPRLWNTTNLGFPKLEAEAILLALSERGVCASAGAACSSGSLEPSPVLRAMGIPDATAHGSVRFSISRDTTEQEVAQAARIVQEVVQRLARVLPTSV